MSDPILPPMRPPPQPRRVVARTIPVVWLAPLLAVTAWPAIPSIARADTADATAVEAIPMARSGPVDYATIDGQPVAGYLAMPDADGPHPALLVVHDEWGLVDRTRAQTRRLADAGYAALAVNLGAAARDSERIESGLRQAVYYLRLQPDVGSIGALSWGRGGEWALRSAALVPREVEAIVLYYPEARVLTSLSAEPGTPLLGHFGTADRRAPVDEIRASESRLAESGHTPEFHYYADADHGFANAAGPNYDRAAAVSAWRRTLAFLDRHLTP